MKQKTHHLYYLYYPRGWIIITLLLFIATATAQEQTPPSGEFPIGATIGYMDRNNLFLHQVYDSTGMNLIEQDAPESPVPYLENYNVHAVNMDSDEDYIYHYSTSYYSKWQAEQDTVIPYIGFKHRDSLGNLIGSSATWHDTLCWSTIGVTSPRDSLLYGPHYHQEKWYRRWLYAGADTLKMNGIYDVRYIPRWRMALDINDTTLGSNDTICRLSVWVRHAPLIYNSGSGQYEWDSTVHNHKLKESTILKVPDFLANGQFKYFYLSDNPNQRWYQYPEAYQSPGDYFKLQNLPEIPNRDTIWTDINGENGVEFRVEWLRSDARCTLYVDYVEVYDDYGWENFIKYPEQTAIDIKNYAINFQNAGWSNIKYWAGVDEPYTIDSYIPIRTVDSLLRSVQAPPLIVAFDPLWNGGDFKVNGEDEIEMFNKIAKREELPIGLLPSDLNFIHSYSFESLKRRIHFEMK
jgi:hypothetical protein